MIGALADVRCTLSGAWLPGVNEPILPLGSGYSHQHQLEMYDAISAGASESVLNTNPTGGGKTLSWAAPIIRSGESGSPLVALATYPTRALIADQQALLTNYFRTYFEADQWARPWRLTRGSDGDEMLVNTESQAEHPLNERVLIVTGASPQESESTAGRFREAERIISRADEDGLPTIVLTTPDALTLLASNRYADSDLGAFPSFVDRIVVDEFHLTSPRGKRLLPFHLDTYLSLGQTPLSQLVFLSATPTATYTDRIERVFDTEQVERKLHSTPPSVGHQILPEVELGITTRQLFTTGEWLSSKSEEIKRFVTPPGQTLIIVDSVMEVEDLASTLASETNYDVGRIYGWKKQGRAEAIEQSDIVVGNTAVEVGVDFNRVNRIVFTAHEPNSALQRLGRMRVNDELDDYKALCITIAGVQDAIHREVRNGPGRITRSRFEEILTSELPTQSAFLPYDAICATYTRYLWSEAEDPLNQEYVPATAREPYKQIVRDHFGPEIEQLHGESFDADSLWEELSESPYLQRDDVLRELHTYRGSSLNCLSIDVDDKQEPLKEYSLTHVLRHRQGRIVPIDQLLDNFEREVGRPPTQDERSYVSRVQSRVECGFIVTGRLSSSRDLAVRDRLWRPSKPELQTLSKLRVSLDPAIIGQEHLNPMSSDVLAHYVPESPRRARDAYDAGAYASLMPYRDGSVFLWQDAILTHATHLAQQTS